MSSCQVTCGTCKARSELARPNEWRGLALAAAKINGRTVAYQSTTHEVQQKRPNRTNYGYRIRTAMSMNHSSDDTSISRPPRPTSTPSPTLRVALKTDIIVIGAGQAGLSSAYHLKKRGLAPERGFVVLDRSPQPGGAWQFRWPSLKLSTVNRIHDLPGMRFSEAVDTDAKEVEASVAVPQYFAAYEKAFGLPVYRPVEVMVVCNRGERLRIETDRGNFSARGVINATGTWETAYIPEYPGAERFRGRNCTPRITGRPRSSQASTLSSSAAVSRRYSCSTRSRASQPRRG